MLPAEIPFAGIVFRLGAPGGAAGRSGAAAAGRGATGSAADAGPPASAPNALAARGQQITLPGGSWRRAYILAASVSDDRRVSFRVGDRAVPVTIQGWRGFLGQWDTRLWKDIQLPADPPAGGGERPRIARVVSVMSGLEAGFVKVAPVAWFATHHHDAEGRNQAYDFAYLFAHVLEIPEEVRTLTLPQDEAVRILAITVSEEGAGVHPLQPLFEALDTEERAVERVARDFLAALSRGDTSTLRSLMLPGMSLASVRQGPQGPVARGTSGEDFLTSLGGEGRRILERMWNPEVRIQDRVAVVWAPYDFHLEGQFSHCGVDVFTLLKVADGWKVTGVTYEVTREGCGTSPLGSPGERPVDRMP
jgi:hypothetical protein